MAAVTGSRRLPRLLANLLLVGLVVYVALVLARTTWLIAWDDRPVAMAPALDSRATVSGGGRLQPPGKARAATGIDGGDRRAIPQVPKDPR